MNTEQQIDYFHRDQKNAISLMHRVLGLIEIGQSEKYILQMFRNLASEYGFIGWLRTPVVHFDYRLSQRFGPSNRRILKKSSVVQIHIQPCSKEAFGNIGTSFSFQSANAPIISGAEQLCVATCTFANHFKKAGELFIFADSWCTNNRIKLNKNSIGHFCFTRVDKGMGVGPWPQNMRLMTQLRRYQLQWYNPRSLKGIYAIHPDIVQDGRRAGFAELLYIDENKRIALGRDSFSDVCKWKLPL
jgi:hypothetical protein